MKKTKNTNLLPKLVTPISYNLILKPDLDNFTFEGQETINILVSKSTDRITLHAKDLEIGTAHILHKKEKIFAYKIDYDREKETVTFLFKEKIQPNRLKLVIVFKGIIGEKLRGFYRSAYQVDGQTRHMATTQFEATDARRAFPCFDEPAQKAVFHVSLIVPKGKTAISNTLPVSVAPHGAGFEIIKFSPTPKMSTYLLAFIVGDFEKIEGKTKNGTLVRVYTTPGKSHQAHFSLDCAVRTLEFYEEYFKIRYPLPVLDMIAIPDFSSLAMENWGAVTYREIGLLVDEDKTSLSSKQMIALVIAHELAHQWFGNLVTMHWWTDLWLNEGFASYIEYLAIDHIYPKWDIWMQFATYEQGTALRLDSLYNTHPIEIEVHHPNEIGEIFDEVSYSKGSAVIRMLAEYLGEEKFRDGLRFYLKKHSYKNTRTRDLWLALEKVSGKPVEKIMRNWTSKGGYPLVSIEEKIGKLVLSQERFVQSPASRKKLKDSTLWQIPLALVVDNKKVESIMSSKKLKLEKPKNWFKANLNESSFLRVHYSKELLKKVAPIVENKIISTIDRLGILRDLFALAESGVIGTEEVLAFLNSYRNEESYSVWLEMSAGLSRIDQLMYQNFDKKLRDKFEQFIIELFLPTFRKLGWEKIKNEPHEHVFLRALTISRLGRAGYKPIIHKAKQLFQKRLKTGVLDPDLRNPVYTIIATHGGLKEATSLLKLYKNEVLHEEKNRIGGALGDFKHKSILKNVCAFALSKDVRSQDVPGILSAVAINPSGRDAWLSFVTKNWKILVSRYGEGGHALGRILKAFSNTPEKKHFDTMRKFFKNNPAPGAERAVEQVLERIESNILWHKRDHKKIIKFLQNVK